MPLCPSRAGAACLRLCRGAERPQRSGLGRAQALCPALGLLLGMALRAQAVCREPLAAFLLWQGMQSSPLSLDFPLPLNLSLVNLSPARAEQDDNGMGAWAGSAWAFFFLFLFFNVSILSSARKANFEGIKAWQARRMLVGRKSCDL